MIKYIFLSACLVLTTILGAYIVQTVRTNGDPASHVNNASNAAQVAWAVLKFKKTSVTPALDFYYPVSFGTALPTFDSEGISMKFDLKEDNKDPLRISITLSDLEGDQSLDSFVDEEEVSNKAPSRMKYELSGTEGRTLVVAISERSALTFYDILFQDGKVLRILFGRSASNQSSLEEIRAFRNLTDEIVRRMRIQ